jgi:small subunit ribosomal protein S6
LATKVYEGMFLLDSNRYARDPAGVSGELNQILQKCGGEILASRLWSEQKLAYPIDGHRKGTYWLTYFRMDSLRQPDLTRACQLNDSILRNLVLSVDERLVDALVAHANMPHTPAPPTEPRTSAPARGRRVEEIDEAVAEELDN